VGEFVGRKEMYKKAFVEPKDEERKIPQGLKNKIEYIKYKIF